MAKTTKDETSEEREEVKIYAINKKYKEKPFLMTPITDNATKKLLTGQHNLTPTELSKQELIIKEDENYPIVHNQTLVLIKRNGSYLPTRDYALYCLALEMPEIALSRKDAVVGKHLMYIQNFEAEAVKAAVDGKTKAQAGAKVIDLSLSDMNNLLFYFGENATNLSTKIAEARVYGLVETRPADVLAYLENLDANQQIVFIKKLLAKKYLQRAVANGYIMYDKVTLGADEKEAAAFIYDDKNNSLYVPLKDMLDKSEGNK